MLDFANLSGDTSDAYLGPALAEMIHTRLAGVTRLTLRSRTLARLGRRSSAAYLLGGTYLHEGRSLVVTVELTHTSSATVAWSGRFDRTPQDALNIERDVAGAVARAILRDLTSAERRILDTDPTRDRVAYALYLRALSGFHSAYSEAGFRRTIELCQQAVARDPRFALAYALSARAWTELGDNWLPPDSVFPRAIAAARRAAAIDSSLAPVHATLASALVSFRWDFAGGEREAALALALDPGLPDAHVAASLVPAVQGRTDEALAHTRRAWELDSLAYYGAAYHLAYLYNARRPDAIEAFLHELGSVVPDADRLLWEGSALLLRGRCADAAETLRHATGFPVPRAMWRARALSCAGRADEARAMLDSLTAVSQTRYVEPNAIAAIHAALGDPDSAFAWLERAYDRRAGWLIWLNVWPEWDLLRGDARFLGLVRRVGLASER